MLSFLIDSHKTWIKIALNCSKTKGTLLITHNAKVFFLMMCTLKKQKLIFFFINKTINVDVDIKLEFHLKKVKMFIQVMKLEQQILNFQILNTFIKFQGQ